MVTILILVGAVWMVISLCVVYMLGKIAGISEGYKISQGSRFHEITSSTSGSPVKKQ